ncbi:MAG: DUF3846 domain-containing protein [Clostridia bacterium]|nr:DUF3846 domain-containing protein [Clostridia bacterium]
MTNLLLDGLLVEPKEHPYEISIINDEDLMAFNLTENIDDICEIDIIKISTSVCIIRNKYAVLNQKSANRKIKNIIIAGNFYIAGINNQGKLTSLTKKQKEKYITKFWETETYTDDEIIEIYLDSLFDM